MKRLLLGFPVFLFAFLIGYTFVPQFRIVLVGDEPPTEQAVQPETDTSSTIPSTQVVDFVPEFRDLPNYDDIAYPESTDSLIDVFETGGVYRESEVIALNLAMQLLESNNIRYGQ